MGHLLLDRFLMFLILLLDVVEEMLKEGLIIHNQLVDDRPVDVLRWKFIGVPFFYHFCHLCEVTGDLLRVLLDDQVVVEDDVLHEYRVVWQVFEQGLELEVLSAFALEVFAGLLHQHFDVTICHHA